MQDSRIQERMEELERERAHAPQSGPFAIRSSVRALESLRLARTELERAARGDAHERRRAQIAQAIDEIDRRMAEVSAARA